MHTMVLHVLPRIMLCGGAFLMLAVAVSVRAELRLPAVIGDNMVLQRDRPATIWGWAGPEERITLRFQGQVQEAVADAEGGWRLVLSPVAAGGPFALSVSGNEREIVVHNVLTGDVWLGSGQSNMAWGMSEDKIKNGAAELASADYPRLRLFTVNGPPSPSAKADIQGRWVECSPATVQGFSAVAYFFGRALHRTLDIPVGLIVSAWHGSPAESWVSYEGLKASPELVHFADRFDESVDTYAEKRQRHGEKMREFERQREAVEPYKLNPDGWEKPGLDDSNWDVMEQPSEWEHAGLFMDGTIVFRRVVLIPEAWAGRALMLSLGPIEDDDIVWFNGVRIGESPPPQRFPLWPQSRRYVVAAEHVDAGEALVAVHITNRGGAGGMTGVPDDLYLKPLDVAEGDRVSLSGPWRYRIATLRHQRPSAPMALDSSWLPTGLFNGRIAPLTPLTLCGILWYQGEANAWRAQQYRTLFPALITDWRRHWGRRELPFLFVQLPSLRDPLDEPAESDWAELREAQALALALPATAMAVTLDAGEAQNVHPSDKQTVGLRLARQAFNLVYEHKGVHSGPMLRDSHIEGRSVRLFFDDAGSGLVARDGDLDGFAVAGDDRQFVWANASIEGDTVRVSSPVVNRPVAVRYAWACNPVRANLYNREGLPAAPFRTDRWPSITAERK